MIEREIAITYNDKKFIVKFPNVGQLMDIESLKMEVNTAHLQHPELSRCTLY